MEKLKCDCCEREVFRVFPISEKQFKLCYGCYYDYVTSVKVKEKDIKSKIQQTL